MNVADALEVSFGFMFQEACPPSLSGLVAGTKSLRLGGWNDFGRMLYSVRIGRTLLLGEDAHNKAVPMQTEEHLFHPGRDGWSRKDRSGARCHVSSCNSSNSASAQTHTAGYNPERRFGA